MEEGVKAKARAQTGYPPSTHLARHPSTLTVNADALSSRQGGLTLGIPKFDSMLHKFRIPTSSRNRGRTRPLLMLAL